MQLAYTAIQFHVMITYQRFSLAMNLHSHSVPYGDRSDSVLCAIAAIQFYVAIAVIQFYVAIAVIQSHVAIAVIQFYAGGGGRDF